MRLNAFLLAAILVVTGISAGQSAPAPTPQDYRGIQVHVPGVFVTPVPNAPFTAMVDIVSHQLLSDGTTQVRTTVNQIARQSSGRIYNERRRLVPIGFEGMPALTSAHIYDPNSRLSIYIEPATHLAREQILKQPLAAPANTVPNAKSPPNPLYKEEDLGTQPLGQLTLRGTRKTRTIPHQASDTGKDVVIVDEYWYSPDLSIYMIIKHNDPRTGEQIIAVSAVRRGEPDAALFTIPANYKLVDETPAN